MIDHVSVAVSDLDASTRFYEAVLGTLGMRALERRPATVGFGKSYPEFWINLRADVPRVREASGAHICFRARTPEIVDAFHAAALSAGGKSTGAPGLRPQHGEGYYAAFVTDPDGNCVEAVNFVSESLRS
jgi:catechol 2,3-dioxygenase-like lactoylglutathione lyase family enzyme